MTSTPTPVAGLTTRPATGTTPAHGTESRYYGSKAGTWAPCRCKACARVHSLACKRRRLARQKGAQLLVPREQIIGHLQKLVRSGMSKQLIARRAGVSSSTVGYLINGRSKSCQWEKAARLLAVKPGDFDDTCMRPAVGTRRRIQALYAMGHNATVIARACGLSIGTVRDLSSGERERVDESTAGAIRCAYSVMSRQQGSSVQSRRRAERKGWLDPTWWEDYGHIDDPAFDPASAEQGLSRNELGAVRREEIAHLGSFGLSDDEIAARMGLSAKHVREVLRELRTGERRDRGAVA